MEPAILSVRYPLAALPARGYRCPRCGEEWLRLAEGERLEQLARRLGLFGVENPRRRKLQRTGNSLTVSLSPDLVRTKLGGAKPGDEVIVGEQGGRIVILPADGAEA